jgi:hypothetical protein
VWKTAVGVWNFNFTLCSPCILTLTFNFFNQWMHLFISVQFTLHMFRPWLGHHQGYVDKFTSLFTAPFSIITTVTLFKAIIYVGNHQYTQFLQAVCWNGLVYSTINCELLKLLLMKFVTIVKIAGSWSCIDIDVCILLLLLSCCVVVTRFWNFVLVCIWSGMDVSLQCSKEISYVYIMLELRVTTALLLLRLWRHVYKIFTTGNDFVIGTWSGCFHKVMAILFSLEAFLTLELELSSWH